MNKFIISIITFLMISTFSKAQSVLPLNGLDCNGVSHDLYADLDAGKASILFFWMPSCSSCPPPAMEIQKMVNKILVNYPGKVTAYAMPFNNTTSCTSSSSWVSTNSLSLYMPYDSGATQVANYGGFGMPTVVLLGGKGTNRRVMFSTLSYTASDTTIMRDSILNILKSTTGTLSLDCSNIYTMGTLTNGSTASGVMIHIPYTNTASGGSYSQVTTSSTGVTGLTATLNSGTFATSGNFRFDITGTPNSAGLAQFVLNINGVACTYKFTVSNNGTNAISVNSVNSDMNIYTHNGKIDIISSKPIYHNVVSLYDIQGNVVMNQNLNIEEGINELPIEILNKGFYILKIENKEYNKSFKVIID